MIQSLFQSLPVGILLALSASSVIFGDYFAKTWSAHQEPRFLALALTGYLFSGVFYIPTLLRAGLVMTSTIWSIAEVAGFLVIGVLIFRESFSLFQATGIALGVASVIMLTIR